MGSLSTLSNTVCYDFFDPTENRKKLLDPIFKEPMDHALILNCAEGHARLWVIHEMAEQIANAPPASPPAWLQRDGSIDRDLLRQSVQMTDKVAGWLLTDVQVGKEKKKFVALNNFHYIDSSSCAGVVTESLEKDEMPRCPLCREKMLPSLLYSEEIATRIHPDGRKFDATKPFAPPNSVRLQSLVSPLLLERLSQWLTRRLAGDDLCSSLSSEESETSVARAHGWGGRGGREVNDLFGPEWSEIDWEESRAGTDALDAEQRHRPVGVVVKGPARKSRIGRIFIWALIGALLGGRLIPLLGVLPGFLIGLLIGLLVNLSLFKRVRPEEERELLA